jgi:hypothetical protein
MPIYLGDKEINKEYVDSYELGPIYLGNNLVQGGTNYEVTQLGLVAYYDISNPSSYVSGSTIIYDLTANNNDMSINDGVVTYNGSNSGILDLSNGFAVATTTTNLPSGSGVNQPDFSYGFWTKYTNYGSQTDAQNAFGFGSTPNGDPNQIAITNVSSSTRIVFGYGNTLSATSTFDVTKWFNVMVTYSGSTNVNTSPGIATIYVNGQALASGSLAVVVSGQGCPISLGIPNGFDVNMRGDGYNGNFGVGYIYNRLLNATEVNSNYNANKNRFGY